MMKKLTLLIVCIFTFFQLFSQQISYKVVEKSEKSIEITIDFQNIKTQEINVNGVFMSKIFLDGAYTLDIAGAPEVLKWAKSILVPDNTVPEMNVTHVYSTTIDNFELIPSKGMIYRNIDPATVPYQKGEQYDVDAFYPEVYAQLEDAYILRDFHGVSLSVFPVSYNPVTKQLRKVTSMTVQIEFNGTLDRTAKRIANEFVPIYESQFFNFQKDRYTVVNEDGDMLIISDATFVSALQSFKTWKIRNGINTEIVTVQSIGNSSTAIKNYITNYYNSHNLVYVLLVGDNQQIAPFMSAGLAQDNNYTEVAGGDNRSDIFLGRMSSENIEHVNTQVNKSINYEQNPAETAHFDKFCGIASNQGPGDNGEYDYAHVRNIDNKLMAYTYSPNGFELFEGNQGGLDAPGNPTAANLTTALNSGIGIINYCGHGADNSFVTTGFNNTNVNALNNVDKLPFIIAVACVNGNYPNQTCFAEAWLRAKKTDGSLIGAVGTLMSSMNQPWNPPMAGQDEMDNILTETATNGTIKRSFGGICFNGLMKMLDTYGSSAQETYRTWLLFGDPSLKVRTATPQTITATHENVLILGNNIFDINSPVNDAKVVLSKGNNILGQGFISNNSAIITFETDNIEVGDTVYVLVSKFNYIPYIAQLIVIQPNGPYITLQSVAFTDQNNTIISGLDLNYDETYSIKPTVKNVGSLSGNNVILKLRTNHSGISLIDSVIQISSINAGEIKSPTTSFNIKVSAAIADLSDINLDIVIYFTDNEKHNSLLATAHAPIIEITGYTIDDSESTEPNGRLNAGETAKLKFNFKNTGSIASKNAQTIFFATDALLSTPNSNLDIVTISTNSSLFSVYDVTVHPVCTSSTFSEVIVKYQCNALLVEKTFFIPIGETMEDWESNTFTKFNWENNSEKPWYLTTDMPYEGTYSASSGTILGNEESILSITTHAARPDSISFYFMVSSQFNKDFFRFYIDGQLKMSYAGTYVWQKKSFFVAEGEHTYTWKYEKDESLAAGLDKVMIDNIVFPPVALFDASNINTLNSNTVDISIFPNPAHSELFVDMKEQAIQDGVIYLYDMSGRIINKTHIASNITKLDLNNLSSGLYLISITDKNAIIKTFKLIKD
ncbi:MAG: C25 family cysteine peptidase [Bacteroidales bacterium]|jgi:gingipain R|nr:C25 family cysteine peptidase [Bacteroidales bacterium]